MDAEATLADAIDGISEQRMQVRADGGLRCRWSPRLINGVLLNNIIGVIPDLEVVIIYPQVTHTRDGYDWILSLSSLGYGWVAKQFLREDVGGENPLPTSSVGVHVAFNGHEGDIVGVAQRLYKAGHPIPLMVIVSDHGLCKRIKEVSPSTIIVYRWVASVGDPGPFGAMGGVMSASLNSDDPRLPEGPFGIEGVREWTHGADWFDELWRHNSQAYPYADYYQNWNECSFAGNTQSVEYAERVNQIEIEHMIRANERGVKVTIGNYMPGVPEKRHVDAMRPAYAFAEVHGHALCYHAYTAPKEDATFETDKAYFGLRWVTFVAPFPRLRVILGEAGRYIAPRFRGDADMISLMTGLETLLQKERDKGRLVDAAYWSIRTQNDPNYRGDDYTAALPAYEEWMRR